MLPATSDDIDTICLTLGERVRPYLREVRRDPTNGVLNFELPVGILDDGIDDEDE
ncbi:MAG: hypothetical protein AB7E74_13130 [Pirellulales bacterium]